MGIKTTFENGTRRVKRFYREHKTGCKIAIGVTATALTCGVGYVLLRNKHSDDVPEIEAPVALPEVTVGQELDVTRGNEIDYTSEWKEEYRDTYNRVNDFAQSLDLVDKEMYVIERNSEFDDIRNALGKPEIIVSHLIDCRGVYPPEEDMEIKEE